MIAIPLAIALFEVCGPFKADAIYRTSGLAVNAGLQVLPGFPTIDPNDGVTSYALGKRAVTEVLQGRLPLWNHYEGLGAPLLGEMQSAALFPPTLLLALPHGQTWERALLQIIAGFGAYLFFRKFGLGKVAALTGGVLFELNGVYAWLHNAIFNPVAFLPWLFLSIENVRAAALENRRLLDRLPVLGLGALAGTLALYAGFPEQVYLYSLLLLCWAIFRVLGMNARHLAAFALNIAMMGAMCLLLSAPLLLAFVSFLTQSMTGAHAGNGFYGAWPPHGTLLQYLLPYVYGPIFGLMTPPTGETLNYIWGNIGGYCGVTLLIVGCAALLSAERRAVKLFLVAWIVVALGASHGWPGIYPAFMTLPLTKIAACFRYLGISWIFCGIFLAALFVDELERRPRAANSRIRTGAMLGAVGIVLMAFVEAGKLVPNFWEAAPDNRLAMNLAIGAAAALAASMCWAMLRPEGKRSIAVSSVLTVEAALWFLVPHLSYPRRGHLDRQAVAFLQENVGYQRVVSTPGYGIAANFGSALNIPLLNYDDIPVPRKTVEYVQRHLDPRASNIFIPGIPPLPPAEEAERQKLFLERLPAYARAGVKYVLAGPNFGGLVPVRQFQAFSVYELPNVREYMSAPGCAVRVIAWDTVSASCAAPSVMTRLEVHMDGWTAVVNGIDTPLGITEDAFQTLPLPAGDSEIAFKYRPPGFTIASQLAGVALLIFAAIASHLIWGRLPRAADRKPAFQPVFARRRLADIGAVDLRPVMESEKARADEKRKSDHVIPPDRFAQVRDRKHGEHE